MAEGAQKSAGKKKLKERKDVPLKDRWNVEALYQNGKTWEKEYGQVGLLKQKPHWPELDAFKGKLGQGPLRLKKLLEITFSLDRKLSKLYTYAHLRHDEDLAQDEYKKAYISVSLLCQDFQEEISWIIPEILSLPEKVLKKYLQDNLLKEYRFYLERIVRLQPHTLSADKESLLAMTGKAMGTFVNTFSAFNNADLTFPNVKNSKGKQLELTHGKYIQYLKEKDRVLRKNTFISLHSSFIHYENTIGELLSGNVQKHLFHARARKYSSCLEAALFYNKIDLDVYKVLIATVRKHLPVLHRYMRLRKKALRVKTLHVYDLYVPLVKESKFICDYAKAQKMVIDSVAPLGEQYQKDLQVGLEKGRWVDRYENARKRSGAYSSGCYDSMPYILMNFGGGINDIMTLAHEAGHSMHSLLSHRHQPYHYSDYSIFIAEVASTFNEELLHYYLVKTQKDAQVKRFLLNEKVEGIRATFFRQTMFAEFELFLHECVEKDLPLTPTLLKEYYRKLNEEYFGKAVKLDEEIAIEWARIPHFYNNFYVYQYATGISAAYTLFSRVMEKGGSARDDYLKFLSAGSSQYPLDLLELAGVNMREAKPIELMIQYFDELVTQLFESLDIEDG